MGQILLAAVLYLLMVFFCYAIPGLIARSRGHRNWRGILVLNLLLGWTVIGWVGALVWAHTESESDSPSLKSARVQASSLADDQFYRRLG